jgi:hypothetical protein
MPKQEEKVRSPEEILAAVQKGLSWQMDAEELGAILAWLDNRVKALEKHR